MPCVDSNRTANESSPDDEEEGDEEERGGVGSGDAGGGPTDEEDCPAPAGPDDVEEEGTELPVSPAVGAPKAA